MADMQNCSLLWTKNVVVYFFHWRKLFNILQILQWVFFSVFFLVFLSFPSFWEFVCVTNVLSEYVVLPSSRERSGNTPAPLKASVAWLSSSRAQSLSMSLYFFLRMETWSLNSTGSSLIWECTKGMKPNHWLKVFMQVCRWAKWSGSAQREDLVPLVWKREERERHY